MTPIKEIWIIMDGIYFIDDANQLNFMEHCATPNDSEIAARALGEWHKKNVYRMDIDSREMTLYWVSEKP